MHTKLTLTIILMFAFAISKAQNTPAIGALKPAETPAAAPQERRSRLRWLECSGLRNSA